jgi:hypothetical protein
VKKGLTVTSLTINAVAFSLFRVMLEGELGVSGLSAKDFGGDANATEGNRLLHRRAMALFGVFRRTNLQR